MVRLWGPDGKGVATLNGHAGAVVTLAFSPNGKQLVSGGADATVRLWDPASGQSAGVLTGCSDAILCLTFARDGRLAAACHDKTVKVWRRVKKTAER
jgi:WD40 repeat protein